MKIDEIVKMIVSADVPDFAYCRSFNDNDFSAAITRRMNKAMDNNPDLQGVAVAFAILPALKWMLKSRKVDEVTKRVCREDAELARLESVQKIIVESSGVSPELFLLNREHYFDNCERLVVLLENTIHHLADYPERGKIYESIMKTFLGDNTGYPSNYLIKRYVEEALQVVYEEAGDKIEEALDVVLDGAIQTDAEVTYIYHNIQLLLQEYSRILWRAHHSDDRAMKLLACKSEKEMRKITESDEKYRQAYLLVEYIRFINGALEMVKTFPNGGEDYYRVLSAIIEMRSKGASYQDVALELNLSQKAFSVRRQRAYTVLGSILWGCDVNAFINILTEKGWTLPIYKERSVIY